MNASRSPDHPRVQHPFRGFDEAFGAKVTKIFGSMVTFWVLVAWQLIWMLLATLGVALFRNDHYPFAFLLFLSNLIQLWALPILGSTTNEADKKRDLAADAEHEALTYIANRLDAIAAELDLRSGDLPNPEGQQ